MALSANKFRDTVQQTNLVTHGQKVGVDSEEFYEGAIVCHNGAGAIAPGANSAGFEVAGICTRRLSTGASNTAEVTYEWGHLEEFPIQASTLDASDIGKNAYVFDDELVCNDVTATNDVRLGRIVDFRTGFVTVHVGVFAGADAP